MLPEINGRRLVSKGTICKETGLSRATIDRRIADGTLIRVKIGSATRITIESYECWLSSLTSQISP